MSEHLRELTDARRAVLVSRQAIYTPELDVMAYTLRFHSCAGEPGGGEHGYHTIAQGLLTSVLDIGLDTLVGFKPAFLPLTRGLLLLGYVDAFPPERVVLTLPATLTMDDEACEVLRETTAHGYAIALDGGLAHDALRLLVACATFLTLDVSAGERSLVATRVAHLRQYALPLVALQVQTWNDFHYCRDLGFAYFHGTFVGSVAIFI